MYVHICLFILVFHFHSTADVASGSPGSVRTEDVDVSGLVHYVIVRL